ncbi:MAG: tetratricopeptide repeat protein [Candidatus Kapaibacterium sp.]
MNRTNYSIFAFSILAGAALLSSCQPYRNFTTYYNRFWNIERIMAEVEDEVDYVRDQQEAPKPRYIIPFDDTGGEEFFSDHLNRKTFDPEEVRANRMKLDSIILKGSMILSYQDKSDYVDDAIYYMSKAYFYMREWYQSQEEARQLIENFPDSKWSPDAHLMIAMDMLEQGRVEEAEEMLSKTVDIAFRFKRADILTEAFRLNADVQMAQGETIQAIKPYERAIVLSDNEEEQARWQTEIGVVLFRAGRFEEAIEAFDKVEEYDPDPVTAFEAGLQKGVALRAAGRFDDAEAQLDQLAEEEDYANWIGLVEVERMSLNADRNKLTSFDPALVKELDSLNAGDYALYGVYERGVRAFKAGDYDGAGVNFSKVASSKSPYTKRARQYSIWINYYREEKARATDATRLQLIPFPDSLSLIATRSHYNIARFFNNYRISDSTYYHYGQAFRWAPEGSEEGARALYALSEFVRRRGNGVEADSLLNVLARNYGDNDYAHEARKRLGYSSDWVPDPARREYESGLKMVNGGSDYQGALEMFAGVHRNHAGSQYAAMALYASGLVFEKYLNNLDSALLYYRLLIERYPGSEQAKAMRPIVEKAMASRRNDTTADPGLVPLDQPSNGNITSTTPPANDTTAQTKVKWYDDALYEPRTDLAMKRRNQRTHDKPYKP